MKYTSSYDSPLGRILLACDDGGLTGLWFEGQKYYAAGLAPAAEQKDTPVLCSARRWLDIYFSGREPDFTPKIHLIGTEYRIKVWEKLLKIPYGSTETYGSLAAELGGSRSFAARAVGGAVGHNPVSIIVPCHRVVGASGSLTGYAGGTDRKSALLRLENARIREK